MSLPGFQFRSGSGNPSAGNALSNPTGTVLSRLSQAPHFASPQGGALTPLQTQVDGLVTHFVEEAANPRTLVALMAGGLAYRFGRIGVMGMGSSQILRPLSVVVGLGTEVTAFEGVTRGLTTLSGDRSNPNLWRWNGPGGWAQGLLSSTITFGMLKGAGFLGREQNVVFQHAFQSTAMVAGHNTAAFLGITSRPEGTLAEQLLHAEATNLQLGAGMSLSHSFAPGLHALERGLDLSLQARNLDALSRLRDLVGPDPRLATAAASSEDSSALALQRPRSARDPRSAHIMMMTGGNDGNGDKKDPSTPPTPLDDATPRSPIVEEEIVSAPTMRVDVPVSGEFDEELRTAQDSVPPEVRFHPAPPPPEEEAAVPVPVPLDLPAPLRMVPTKASVEETPIPEAVRGPGAQKAVLPPAVVVEGEVVSPPATLSPEELAAKGPQEPKVIVEEQFASQAAQARIIARTMRPSVPPSIRIKEGDLLAGKYRITDRRPLGAGGFGEVWRAEDIELGRQVALKVIKRERLEGEDDEARLEEYIRRFEREIKIGANLDPQHSATVYEIRKLDNGTTILVMELLSGHDLSALRNGISRNDPTIMNRFPMERRLEIFTQICEALDSAHRRGFVHMDLKPDNIRVTEEGRVRIMDWGQAKGVGEATHDSGKKISLEVLQEMRQNLTLDGSISGTPGYIAPERFLGKALINPRSPDIFAMGVILYEWVTGVHPYASFIEGDPSEGEAPHVAVRDKNGLTMVSHLATAPGMRKPFPFSQVMVGDRPVFLREVERIALKAMSQNPAQRYQSAAEMRDDVIFATARADRDLIFGDENKGLLDVFLNGMRTEREFEFFEKLLRGEMTEKGFDAFKRLLRGEISEQEFERMEDQEQKKENPNLKSLYLSIREEMKYLEKKMDHAWGQFSVASQIQPEQWARMHRPINRLIQKRAEMNQRAEDLVANLTRIMPQLSNSALARKMIAELSWRRLLHGGDRMPQPVREALMRRIRANDVPTPEDTTRSYADAIDGTLQIEFRPIDFETGESVSEAMRIRVIPYEREKEEEGNELGNYRLGTENIVSTTLGELKQGMHLPAGYYALEVSHPGYAMMRVPLHVRLKDVREGILQNQPIHLGLELIPENKVPKGMVVIHRGFGFIGHDFYRDGMPTNAYSTPLRKISFDTFLVSRTPVTVGEYKIFIESQLDDLNRLIEANRTKEAVALTNQIKELLPHVRVDRIKKKDASEEALEGAFKDLNYNWNVEVERDGEKIRFRLQIPTLDPNGDPILMDQPMSVINAASAEVYADWLSHPKGGEDFPYQLISIVQQELICRNSFSWTYPWGYDFDPSFLATRLSTLEANYPQPVGTFPLGPEKYRDFSLYGNEEGPLVDLLGNVRKVSRTESERGSIYLTGGSVRSPYGVLFLPSARAYVNKISNSDDSNGGFRVVIELPTKRPH